MHRIPQAFLPYPQFIVYQLKPRDGKSGKTDKVPLHPITGAYAGIDDQKIWMDAHHAVTTANALGPNHGVGFVFTENDPFWFVDVDDAVVGDAWKPEAVAIFNRFPNAAFEISTSRKGFHLFGSGIVENKNHANRTRDGLELYTKGRFVALTGISAQGDASIDFSRPLNALITDHFTKPPKKPTEIAKLPTENLPQEDQKIIDLFLGSNICGEMLWGNMAKPQELWTADPEILAKAYPPQNTAQVWDNSAADYDLAKRLAYFTQDAAQINRVMRASALLRNKWDFHPTYLAEMTINNAINAQQSRYVYPQAKTEEPEQTQETQTIHNPTNPFLHASQQLDYFKGCVYVSDEHKILTPKYGLLSSDKFKAQYGGKRFIMTADGARVIRDAFEAFTQSEVLKGIHPFVDSTCFDPTQPFGKIIHQPDRIEVNTYRPLILPSKRGDVTPFLNHVNLLLPTERDALILLSYFAANVQKPGHRINWAIVLQGMQGNGKTILLSWIKKAIGMVYCHSPKPAELTSRFNSWVYRKTFICVEDFHMVAGKNQEIMDMLKSIISDPVLEIEAKGVDKTTREIVANFFFNTNYKNAFKITENDRRYCILFCAQQEIQDLHRDGMDDAYFKDLQNWNAKGGQDALNYYLNNFEIPTDTDPHILSRAPRTSAYDEVIALSKTGVEKSIVEAIESGVLGFRGGWIASTRCNAYLSTLFKNVNTKDLGASFKNLGYMKHPALYDGRAPRAISPDSVRPFLYIHRNSPQARIQDRSEAVEAYIKAQEDNAP